MSIEQNPTDGFDLSKIDVEKAMEESIYSDDVEAVRAFDALRRAAYDIIERVLTDPSVPYEETLVTLQQLSMDTAHAFGRLAAILVSQPRGYDPAQQITALFSGDMVDRNIELDKLNPNGAYSDFDLSLLKRGINGAIQGTDRTVAKNLEASYGLYFNKDISACLSTDEDETVEE